MSRTYPDLTHFEWTEFLCKCGDPSHTIQDIPQTYIEFVLHVDSVVRPNAGFPFYVSSGWRCEQHPIEKGKSAPGPHTLEGMDVLCSHQKAYKLVGIAIEDPVITGIGISQKGPLESRFVHIDGCFKTPYRPRPHLWTY